MFAFLVGLALVVANSIYVGVTTGSADAAFATFFAGAVQLVAGAALIAPAISSTLGAINNPAVSYGVAAASLNYGAYSTVDSARSGNILGAVSAGVNVALSAFAIASSLSKTTSSVISGNAIAEYEDQTLASSPGDVKREALDGLVSAGKVSGGDAKGSCLIPVLLR
ncbi:MAG: hypothetical protein IPK00_21150 [Deltaproteobacteria bacterium]|nr:hypothetical protein [Deltaproteobacteria bacterium]